VQLVTVLLGVAHAAIILGLGLRVVMRRRPVGVAIAWLGLIVVAPFLGAIWYFLFGESRLGERTERRMVDLLSAYRDWLKALPHPQAADWERLRAPGPRQIHDLGVRTIGIPALCGNRLDLLDDAQATLHSIIADIDAARESVHMEFYIWQPGGTADEVAAALIRAVRRGVVCRLLLDSIGGSDFFGSHVERSLKSGGVHVVEALPVGVVRSFIARADHRTHRKIVVVDGRIGYTGSMNLVDPRDFKLEAGVGQWIDAMVRLEGPAVEALAVTFIADWELGTDEGLGTLARTLRKPETAGSANVQVIPSGPGYAPEAIHKLILTGIYSAREELIVTTPYFVPTDSLLTAIESAAQRGVDVTIIVPARNDSRLVHFASRSTFDDLLAAGVRIAAFRGGLLHTKAITVDGHTSIVGSVNLDMRSFYLNFEISLFVYDAEFTGRLRHLQHRYLADSSVIVPAEWARRPFRQSLAEDLARLLGPLL